jgi:hypothetical protein
MTLSKRGRPRALQSRIDGFTFESEYREDAFTLCRESEV